MNKLFYSILFVFIFSLPLVAPACPLCQGGQGYSNDSIFAYKAMTLFLALLPILGCGGIFYWIYCKYKRIERDPE